MQNTSNAMIILIIMLHGLSLKAQLIPGDDLLNTDNSVAYRSMAYNMPTYKYCFSFPALGQFRQEIYHSGFAFRDLVDKSGNVDYERAINKLDAINYLGTTLSETWLSAGFKVNRFWVRLSVDEQFHLRVDYPGNLFRLAWLGNGSADFLGKRVDLSGLGLQFIDRRNYAIGIAAASKDERWHFGVNLRYIDGRATLQTTESRLGWTTSKDDYSWTFDGKMRMVSSGIPNGNNLAGTPGDLLKRASGFKGNNGFSIDAGASFQMNEQLNIGLNAADIGFISWKKEILNYTSSDLSYVYNGLDAQNIFGSDTLSSVYEQLLDSIPEAVLPSKDSSGFTTKLKGNYVLQGRFAINKKNTVSLSVSQLFSFNASFRSVYLGYRYEPWERIGLTTGIGYHSALGFSVGAGTCVHFGAFALNVSTGNIVAFIEPSRSRYASLQFGLNFIFGREEKKYR